MAAGPAVARRGDVLLLVDGADPSGSVETHAHLQGNREDVRRLMLVGGRAAISNEVEAKIRADLERP